MTPILIDMDGVLRIGSKPAKYLNEFVEFLRRENLPFCIVSNSTLTDKKLMKNFFEENSIELSFPIMTAVDATYSYVKERFSSIALYCSDAVKPVFSNLKFSDEPEVVVVGDLEDAWNFKVLNDIFNKILKGAKLVAMQKNKFWKHPEKGFLLDAGAFITAIEYAACVKATVIGKPSPLYFKQALQLLNKSSEKFIMIGDDLITDIYPVKPLGGQGILVMTGKTSPDMLSLDDKKNIPVANNLLEVINIIKQINL